MAVESPVCTGAISRKPLPELNTAALLILMSIALWIESPIIDLLSTSTTLSKNRTHYLELRRFVIGLVLLVATVHAIIVFTPLYWVITERIIGVDHNVAATARTGLALMLPWAPSIGWRRFLQGILIRFDKTRFVALGTATRVTGMSLAALGLFAFTKLPGIQLGACALICGVVSEASVIHWASRRTIREQFDQPDEEAPLGLRKLLNFHTPLTMTTMIIMCGTPIVSAALARMPDPLMSLAAFQVAAGVQWLLRSFTYALPEVVITLYKDEQSARALKGFCLWNGALASGALIVFGLTGIDVFMFTKVLGATPDISRAAHIAFLAGGLLPFIGGCQSYVRGMLTAYHLTVSRLNAVAISVGVLVGGLAIGVHLQANGLVTSGVAYTVALTAELAFLAYAWRAGSRRLGI